MTQFKRVNQHAKLFGLCGGFAYWLGLPAWLVRLLVVLLVSIFNEGWFPYLLAGLLAPEWEIDPEDYEEVASD